MVGKKSIFGGGGKSDKEFKIDFFSFDFSGKSIFCCDTYFISMSLIVKLVRERVLTEVQRDTFQCVCGSTLKRKSVRGHVQTKKHLSYTSSLSSPSPLEEVEAVDCPVCYETQTRNYRCGTCRNIHCMTCHVRLDKCPLCRTEFSVDQSIRKIKDILRRGPITDEHDLMYVVERYKEWNRSGKFGVNKYAELKVGMEFAVDEYWFTFILMTNRNRH